MINLISQSCLHIKDYQATKSYQSILTKMLNIFLNLSKSVRIVIDLYEEDLIPVMSQQFINLESFPEIQMLFISLAEQLSFKSSNMELLLNSGIILQIIKKIGKFDSPEHIKTTVKAITSFSKLEKFVILIFQLTLSSQMNMQKSLLTLLSFVSTQKMMEIGTFHGKKKKPFCTKNEVCSSKFFVIFSIFNLSEHQLFNLTI
jgi:hypothetical protein